MSADDIRIESASLSILDSLCQLPFPEALAVLADVARRVGTETADPGWTDFADEINAFRAGQDGDITEPIIDPTELGLGE